MPPAPIVAALAIMTLHGAAQTSVGQRAAPDAAAPDATEVRWIRPSDARSPAVWGIREGIVFSLWPYDVETGWPESHVRPRGLIRIGHDLNGVTHLLNFVAVEPVVEGQIEYSEISPSRVDGRWGKLMWAGDTAEPGSYSPSVATRGTVTRPDLARPEIEELSVYVFMEPFMNGAHPYLRLSIRSDRPEEIGFEIFHHEGSAAMDRCALTATMGNYARLRRLQLDDRVVDARELYSGYDGIGFVEEEPYPAGELARTAAGDVIAVASGDESFAELAAWPQRPDYLARWTWRYRPYYRLSQYWRKDGAVHHPSLEVRVNGRARYWAGGSQDPGDYTAIPGGVSFENFEMREDYSPGQKFYFGVTRASPDEVLRSR